ncbi:hypothetical protein H0O00_00010 [Candidatus Micrarchaeota archaeon]|nr:hypothetical protein [Candidatus Micrarchaeota archaeon]
MTYGSFLGIAAAVIATAAFIPYIRSVLKGKTRPNRATWFIWFVLGIIICASYWSVGARNTFWITLPVGTVLTALLSIKYGVGGWTPFDRMCLLGAGFGLLLWWVSGIPFTALVIGILIDMIGYLPTMKKIWHDQGSEDRLTWTMFFISSVLNVFALETWVFEIAIFPLYVVVFNGAVMALLFFPRRDKFAKNLSAADVRERSSRTDGDQRSPEIR